MLARDFLSRIVESVPHGIATHVDHVYLRDSLTIWDPQLEPRSKVRVGETGLERLHFQSMPSAADPFARNALESLAAPQHNSRKVSSKTKGRENSIIGGTCD